MMGYYQIYVDDEKFVDMSTSISGSGPAYMYVLYASDCACDPRSFSFETFHLRY